MRKIATALLSLVCFSSLSAFATKHIIKVSATEFKPNNLKVFVGDTIRFERESGSQTFNSTSVPVNAFSFGPPSPVVIDENNLVYEYAVKVGGQYLYASTINANIKGSFSATSFQLMDYDNATKTVLKDNVWADTIVVDNISPTTIVDIKHYLAVKNVNSSVIQLRLKRKVIYEVSGSISFFCIGVNCYAPTVNVATSDYSLLSKDTLKGKDFYVAYNPNGNPGTSLIRYTIYDEYNKGDSAYVFVKWISKAAAANPAIVSNNNQFSMYPNPATDVVNIKITDNKNNCQTIKVKLNNMLGATIKEFILNSPSDNIMLNVADMPKGIYFVSLQLDNTVYTKRLIVR